MRVVSYQQLLPTFIRHQLTEKHSEYTGYQEPRLAAATLCWLLIGNPQKENTKRTQVILKKKHNYIIPVFNINVMVSLVKRIIFFTLLCYIFIIVM